MPFRHAALLASVLGAFAGAAYAEEPDDERLEDFFAIMAEEVTVVSSTGVSQRIGEAPSVISVITRDDLVRRGYRTLAEALQVVPGLSFVDDHLLPNLTIRGVFGDLRGWGRFVKLMIDGQPIAYQPGNTNWFGLASLPLDVVDHIEVIRGPASTLYGANAFLGVVNVITRAASDVPLAGVNVAGVLVEGNPGVDANLIASVEGEGWHALVAATATHEDRSGLQLEPTYALQPPELLHGGVESEGDVRFPKSLYLRGAHSGELGELRLSGLVQHLHSTAEFQEHSVLREDNVVSLINGYLRLDWSRAFDDFALRAAAAYSAGGPLDDDRIDLGLDDAYFRRRFDYRGGNATLEGTTKFWQIEALTVGIDLAFADQANPTGVEVLTGDRGVLAAGTELPIGDPERTLFLDFGAYAQAQVRILDELLAVAGGRLDQHNLFGLDFSGRLALVATLTEALSTKLMYGSSIMAPAPDQLYSLGTFGQLDVRGNPELEMQSADTVELAFDYTEPGLGSLRLDGFVTRVGNKIEFQRLGPARRAVNSDALLVGGVEIEARTTIDRVSAFASAGLATGRRAREDTGSIIDADDPANDLLPAAPLLTGALGVNVAVPEAFVNAYVESRLLTERAPTRDNFVRNNRLEDYALPAVVLVDATLSTIGLRVYDDETDHGSTHDDTTVYLRVTNLLGTRYSEPGFSGIDVPALGRAFFVGLRHELR